MKVTQKDKVEVKRVNKLFKEAIGISKDYLDIDSLIKEKVTDAIPREQWITMLREDLPYVKLEKKGKIIGIVGEFLVSGVSYKGYLTSSNLEEAFIFTNRRIT